VNQKTKIKAVIFDCFGVLTGDKWKEFVGSLPESQKSDARDLNRAMDKGIISQAEFFEHIHSLTGRSVADVKDLINSEMHKNSQLITFIKGLKGSYKLAVLSNVSNNWIRDSFLSKEETDLFDMFVLSYEVGLIKPDPEIYRVTAERLGVDLDECLFIDDSPLHTQAAKAQGMKAITYQNFQQFKIEADKLLLDNSNN
jgi:HAD superfamily hydrolase (TIGR01509 family)